MAPKRRGCEHPGTPTEISLGSTCTLKPVSILVSWGLQDVPPVSLKLRVFWGKTRAEGVWKDVDKVPQGLCYPKEMEMRFVSRSSQCFGVFCCRTSWLKRQ